MCLWISDVSKEMWEAENFNKYSSKFTENFKGIELQAPLILNVNCAKILEKFFDFIACVKSIKKSFRMMYSNLCLSFRETVHLRNRHSNGRSKKCSLRGVSTWFLHQLSRSDVGTMVWVRAAILPLGMCANRLSALAARSVIGNS